MKKIILLSACITFLCCVNCERMMKEATNAKCVRNCVSDLIYGKASITSVEILKEIQDMCEENTVGEKCL